MYVFERFLWFLALFGAFWLSFKVLGRFRGLAGCPRGWAPPRINKKLELRKVSVFFWGGRVLSCRVGVMFRVLKKCLFFYSGGVKGILIHA